MGETTTTPARQRALMKVAQERAGLTTDQTWLRYFSLGGVHGPEDLQRFLDGVVDLPPQQRDLVAVVLNERLDELTWRHRVPYSRTDREASPDAGPLAALTALTDLLRGTHMAPPERIVEVLDGAAADLGVEATIYLADYAQEWLVPMTAPGGHQPEPLAVDGTLAGRSFQRLETSRSSGDRPHMWLPIIDGVERLGVLDVTVSDERELHDPVLHRQCWWLTHYLGHLIDILDQYGDAVDAVRRRRPRSVAAELVWQLLPPLDAATDKVIISGRLEPAHAVGGDVFDYALSEDRAQLAVVDATGHDLRAGLAAAAVLAAYRNARREGHGLLEQGQMVQRALVEQFGDEHYATGVLGELDTRTGRLRYLAAGHPEPLLLRNGRVVKTLQAGRRPLFGVEARDIAVGEEQLEPGDVVVVYTDGITEARDGDGRDFGLPRLVDFLERQHAEGTPLPEVVRRLCKTILTHQGGVLQDDATLLLVHWTTEGQASLEPTLLA